jgi:pimeloyl-ACP methyl ester carboxylesterase
MREIKLQLPFNGFHINGTMVLPVKAQSIIIFAHGLGIASESPHEQAIARLLQENGWGTLMFDMLDENDQQPDSFKNLIQLSEGLLTATQWLNGHSQYQNFNIVYLGSGNGAAIAYHAANKLPDDTIKAIISVSGRIDLVHKELTKITCPSLFIVGEIDFQTVKSNQHGLKYLKGPKQLAVIPSASHLFEETGKQKEVANIINNWLKKYTLAKQKA